MVRSGMKPMLRPTSPDSAAGVRRPRLENGISILDMDRSFENETTQVPAGIWVAVVNRFGALRHLRKNARGFSLGFLLLLSQ